LGVALHGIGLEVGLVFDQSIQEVDRFVDAAGDEMAEQRNVPVRDVVIADATVTALVDMAFREQILLVEIPLRAIGGSVFAVSPVFGQEEWVVGIDHPDDGLLQTLRGHVVQVQPRDLLATESLDRARRLRRTQIAPVTEQRGDEP
jgi:hypothetical protein